MCRQPAMSVNRPVVSDGGPEDFPYPAPDRQSRCPITFPACVSTCAPRRRSPGRRPPFHMPIPPATSTDCTAASNGGRAVIPWPVVWGLMAIALPRSRSPGRFGHATTRYVDHPQAAMGSRHRSGTAPGPVGDRPHPTSHPCRRSNSNHAGKSTYSGEIESLDRDPGIATYRELTSLASTIMRT